MPTRMVGTLPPSMSISVIGLPFGSYIGLASGSILEVLIAGYEAPDRNGADFATFSTLATGIFLGLFTGSWGFTRRGDCFATLARGGCLWGYI